MTARTPFTIVLAICAGLLTSPAASAQQGASPADRQALLGLARVKRDAGDRTAARRHFEDAARLRPLEPDELAEYFWLLAGLDSSAALSTGRAVLADAPSNPDVRDRMITEAIALHDETAVVQLASEGHRLAPAIARWPRRLGESYLRQGRADDAAAAFDVAIKASGTVIHDRVGLAIALEAAGRHQESVTAWDGVPESVRSEREEWKRSWLRALAQGAPPHVAADALEAWLQHHQDDDASREMLVDVWVRSGQIDRALAAMPASHDSDTWTRRRVAVARSAGRHATAIAALDGLVARGAATAADRWVLAAALIDNHAYERAASTLRAFASRNTSCDDRLLTLTDRIPGVAGTDLMMIGLAAPRCNDTPRWLQRGIARTLALSRHQEALALLARLPQADQNRPANRRLTGQLQLWTGDVRGALATLETVLESAPADNEARAALVDVYRASHQTANAWRTAAPLLADTSLPADRVVLLAELALEADHPEQALLLLNRISSTPANSIARAGMVGRSLLALGQPAEARAALSSVPASSLTPPAALALIDSVNAVSGATAALEVARQFPGRAREWQDVIGRHAMLEAVAGDAARSASLLQALKGIDANAAVYAEAATALAMRRPHEALTVLAKLPDDPQPDRAADLESTALAGVGRIADALAIVVRLRKTHSDSPSLMVREADLSFQLSPTPEALARLVDLSKRFPGNQMAAVALARGFATLRRHADAIAALGPAASWRSLPDDGRLVLGRSLQALGRPGEALVIFAEADATNVTAQELRAELLAVVDGPGRAAEVFAQAAQRPDATPQLFLKWAAVTEHLTARVDVLTRGTKRFPSHGGMLVALASARQAAGDSHGARGAALQAIEVDPQFADAWFVLLDATTNREGLTDVVRRFDSAAAGHPALAIGMAERAARFIQSVDDPLVASTMAWLDVLRPTDATQAMARDLARARIFSAAERWPESLGAVDTALARDPHSLPALRLRAELLSWSGRHADAMAAYDTYLAAAPHDVDARRQQARVAGWAGSFGQAKRLYASLVSAFPNDAIIAAEAEAKAAFFDGRWRAAAEAYARWIALEPDNTEARFERAEALRAAGRITAADAALATLASTPNDQIASAALARNQIMRRPSASIIAESKSASGYGGQRLLDLREEGAGVRATFGDTGRVALNTEAAHVRASAASLAYHGLHAGLTGSAAITPAFGLEARASVWNFPIAGGVTPDVRIRAAWRPADRWIVGAGAAREPLFENLTTLERRIAGTGAFADIAFTSPRTSVSVRASAQSLTDGNDRTRATISMSHAVSDRLRQLRVVGWAESLSYRTSSADYYSPAQLLRLDVGVEYAHEFRAPKFRGDRQHVVAGGYLIGVDGDGTRYHHPSMRLQIEFARGLAIDARAGWIRSEVYNETSLFIGLRIETHGGRR